jgi:DNA-binding transcriptional MocR family regulator
MLLTTEVVDTVKMAATIMRPKAIKAFDTQQRVLYCASVSKTLSPGLRVGWCAPGRYQVID